jgi:predicted nucleic acid-binding protein
LIVVDTGGVLVLRDHSHRLHEAARAVVEADPGPFLLSPFCLAEIDYMLSQHVGRDEQLDLLDDVASGAYTLVRLGAEEVARSREIIVQYADLRLSLADASIVVVADLYAAERLLTIDERDFRVVRRRDARPFQLLPSDA